MKLTWLKSLGLLATLTFVACDIEGAIDDLEQAAIEEAFKGIKDSAQQNGGDAAMVFPNKETVLVVNNPSSPLNGAKIVIAAGSLPADIEQASATIQTPGVLPEAETDALKVKGPYALVGLVSLPGLESVVPVKPVSIQLPYTKDATTPVEQVGLGSVGNAGLTKVPGSSATDTYSSGVTTELNIHTTVWSVDYTGGAALPGTFAYKVTKADNSVACVGVVEFKTAFVGSLGFNDASKTLNVYLGQQAPLTYMVTDNTISTTTTAIDATVGRPAEDGITITCTAGSFKSNAISEFTVAFSNLNSSTTDVVGEITYTTTDGVKVEAAVNATAAPFSWN